MLNKKGCQKQGRVSGKLMEGNWGSGESLKKGISKTGLKSLKGRTISGLIICKSFKILASS